LEIVYTPELLAYMKRKGKMNISVEVASSDHSDFEITELYLRLVTDDFAAYLIQKKRYRGVRTDQGQVLFPPYRLFCNDRVVFSLKKIWIFHALRQEGIRL
jgi:hypothetical protein